MAQLTSRLTSFRLEQEGDPDNLARVPTIHEAVVMGVRVRLSGGWVYLRSSCCGEPLEHWYQDGLPEYTCGGCGDETGYSVALTDRLPWDDFMGGGLQPWTNLDEDPLTVTLECALACDELLAAWSEAVQ